MAAQTANEAAVQARLLEQEQRRQADEAAAQQRLEAEAAETRAAATQAAEGTRERVAPLLAAVTLELRALAPREAAEADRFARDCPKWVARGGCSRNGPVLARTWRRWRVEGAWAGRRY